MQKMLDSLHGDVRLDVEALGVLVDKRIASLNALSQAGEAAPRVGTKNEFWGIRGPKNPGSLQNPIVTVLEAGKRQPMGAYAAAVGEDTVADVQRGSQSSGMATAVQLAALSQAVSDLGRSIGTGSLLAQAVQGSQGSQGPEGATQPAVQLAAPEAAALERAAAALERMEAAQRASGSSRTVIVDHPTQGGGRAQRVFVAGSDSRSIVSAGPGGTGTFRLDGAQYAGLISALAANRGGGVLLAGGGGGSRTVDIFHHASGDAGGGGGGGGLLAALGWGGGVAGMAGIGSALSFAGLGFEHLLTTALSVIGSAFSGLLGGGLLGLGAAGQIGVGAGSDIAVMKSTIADTKTLSTDMTNLAQAQALYGKNSTQAATATKQLNYDMATLGNTAGVKAEAGLAQASQALDKFWDMQTSGARVQAVHILMQGIQAGYTFVPMIAQAAERNLAQINQSLKPLFAWLQGPQGIQIFNDLENRFAHDLPYAMHAFDQGAELLLRVIDIASQYTGGFVQGLDRLFTRLNSMDNAQLTAWVQKYINDFRLWEHFLKLVVQDIYGLFHQDVGTGNAIILSLTKMLEHLRAYEQSATGSAQIQNIFMVHKTEILELIKVLASLGDTFAHIYMAVAPALVTAMNDVVLPVLNAIGSAFAFIAKQSNIAATGMGLFLIGAKMFGAGATVTAIRAFLGLGGAKAAAGAAAGGGILAGAEGGAAGGAAVSGLARLTGGIERGSLAAAGGVEKLGLAGAADFIAGAGGSIAAGAAAALPLLLAGGAAEVVARAVVHASGVSNLGPTTTFTPGGAHTTPGAFKPDNSFLGKAANTAEQLILGPFGFTTAQTLRIKEIGNYANYSAAQLRALITQLKATDSVKVNGVAEDKKQVLALAEAALKLKDSWNRNFNQAWMAVNNFYRNNEITFGKNKISLVALKDDFESNMRLIAHTMGVNSDAGRRLVGENVRKMVQAVTEGMTSGKIHVNQGMAAIKDALKTGMQQGALTWKSEWKLMFATVNTLYAAHKISTQQYLGDLHGITKTGLKQIAQDTKTSYQQTFANLKSQFDDGLITQLQYNREVHATQVKANAQERSDMAVFVGNVAAGMVSAGVAAGKGADAIIGPLNTALKQLGARPLSLVGVTTAAVAAGISSGISGLTPGFVGHAQGGLVQFGRPGDKGRDQIPVNMGGVPIMVGSGEIGAVLTGPQQQVANYYLSPVGGLPGLFSSVPQKHHMAGGGIVTASEYGGPGDPGTGSHGYKGDNLYAHPDSYAELNMGTALGGLPYLAPLDVTLGSKTARLLKRDIGAGGPGLGGHIRAIDLWFQAANALGLGGLANVMINGGQGVNVKIAGGVGAALTQIMAPHVTGAGALAALDQAGLNRVAKAANAFLAKQAPAVNVGVSPGGGGMPFRHGRYTFPLPAGSWTPGSIDQGWDIAAPAHTPEFAIGPGVITGHGISGFGPWAPILQLDQSIGGGSVYYGHAGPGGELPVGTHVSAGEVIGEIGAGDVGISTGPHLEIGWYPPGGMGAGASMKSALGYEQGGMFGTNFSNSSNAPYRAKNPATNKYETHTPAQWNAIWNAFYKSWNTGKKKVPSGFPPTSGKTPKPKGPPPTPMARFGDTGSQLIDGALSQITRMLGPSGVVELQGKFDWMNNLNSNANYQLVVTQDAQGNPVAPYIDWTAVNKDLGQLEQMYQWESAIKNDYRTVLSMLAPLVERIQAEIAKRKAMIDAAKKRIRENLAVIKALQKKLHAHGVTKTQKGALNAQISQYEADNMTFGGSKTAVGSGGQIGGWAKEITALQTGLGTARSYQPGGSSQLEGEFALDPNAPYGGAVQTLAGVASQIGALSPTALAAALTAADASSGTSSQDQQEVALLQELLQQSNEALFVSQQQYGVLSNLGNLPPFAGTFHSGGTVPGPVGQEALALVRSGETISPAGREDGMVHETHVHISGRNAWLNDLIDARVEQKTRRIAGQARRALPSRGGGQISPARWS